MLDEIDEHLEVQMFLFYSFLLFLVNIIYAIYHGPQYDLIIDKKWLEVHVKEDEEVANIIEKDKKKNIYTNSLLLMLTIRFQTPATRSFWWYYNIS